MPLLGRGPADIVGCVPLQLTPAKTIHTNQRRSKTGCELAFIVRTVVKGFARHLLLRVWVMRDERSPGKEAFRCGDVFLRSRSLVPCASRWLPPAVPSRSGGRRSSRTGAASKEREAVDSEVDHPSGRAPVRRMSCVGGRREGAHRIALSTRPTRGQGRPPAAKNDLATNHRPRTWTSRGLRAV